MVHSPPPIFWKTDAIFTLKRFLSVWTFVLYIKLYVCLPLKATVFNFWWFVFIYLLLLRRCCGRNFTHLAVESPGDLTENIIFWFITVANDGFWDFFLRQTAIMFLFHVILATNGIFSADIDGTWFHLILHFLLNFSSLLISSRSPPPAPSLVKISDQPLPFQNVYVRLSMN